MSIVKSLICGNLSLKIDERRRKARGNGEKMVTPYYAVAMQERREDGGRARKIEYDAQRGTNLPRSWNEDTWVRVQWGKSIVGAVWRR